MQKVSKTIPLIGLAIWTISALTLLFLPEEYIYVHPYKRLPNLYWLLIAIVIGPIIEELVYRYGLRFKQYTYYYIIIGLSTYLILSWEVLAGLAFASLILHHTRLVKIDQMIIVGSLSFSAIHFRSYQEYNVYLLASMSIVFGISLILSYVRIRKGIFSAIVLHAVYNLLLTSIEFYSNDKNVAYEDNDIKLEMYRSTFFTNNRPMIRMNSDSVVFESTTVADLLEMEAKPTNEFHYYPESVKYDGFVLFKTKDLQLIEPIHLGYESDSTVEQGIGYALFVGDPVSSFEEKIISAHSGSAIRTLKEHLEDASKRYRVPIKFLNSEHPAFHIDAIVLSERIRANSFEEYIEELSKRLAIEISIQKQKMRHNIVVYRERR